MEKKRGQFRHDLRLLIVTREEAAGCSFLNKKDRDPGLRMGDGSLESGNVSPKICGLCVLHVTVNINRLTSKRASSPSQEEGWGHEAGTPSTSVEGSEDWWCRAKSLCHT